MRNVSTVNASYRADYEIDIPGPDQAALIAGTGAGQSIKFIYQPEAGDKSSKIVFIQVAQALLDKVPVKPSKISLAWQYLDADTTPEFWWVDSRLGEKDPYYKGDDKGLDIGVQGNAIPPNKRDAITDDKPIKNDVFPPLSSEVNLDYYTMAFSAAGADAGTFYAFVTWHYYKKEGHAGKILGKKFKVSGKPPQKVLDAINLWCTNHGFKLP